MYIVLYMGVGIVVYSRSGSELVPSGIFSMVFPANTAGGRAAKNTNIINNRFIFHNHLQISSKELASACNQN
jgi:hypothetical protein